MTQFPALPRGAAPGVPFAAVPQAVRAERLRQHLSPREAQLFGIDQAYDDAGAEAANPVLRGLGAAFASAALFVTVGALALPAAAFA